MGCKAVRSDFISCPSPRLPSHIAVAGRLAPPPLPTVLGAFVTLGASPAGLQLFIRNARWAWPGAMAAGRALPLGLAASGDFQDHRQRAPVPTCAPSSMDLTQERWPPASRLRRGTGEVPAAARPDPARGALGVLVSGWSDDSNVGSNPNSHYLWLSKGHNK